MEEELLPPPPKKGVDNLLPPPPKKEERSIFGVLPIIGDAIHYGGKAVERGFYQGQTADVINPYVKEGDITKESIEDVARYQSEILERPPSKFYKEATESPTFLGSLKAFAERPLTTLTELMGESLSAMATHGATRILGGAAAGAGVGLTGLGVGAVPGAATGALAATPAVSLNLEYSGKILQGLSELGIDTTKPDEIINAFADPTISAQLREKAFMKAVPIAAFDALSAGIAGKFLKGAVAKGTSKLIAGGKELGTQMATGAAGELSGQLVSGENIQPGAILSEAIGEIGGGTFETATGAISNAAKHNDIDAQLDPVLKEAVDSEATKITNELINSVSNEQVQKPQTENLDVRQQTTTGQPTQEKPKYKVQGEIVPNPELDSIKEQFRKANEEFLADPSNPEVAERLAKLSQQLKDSSTEKSTKTVPFQQQINELAKLEPGQELTDKARMIIEESSFPDDVKRDLTGLLEVPKMNLNDRNKLVDGLKKAAGISTTTIKETTLAKRLRDAWRSGITLGRKDEKADRKTTIKGIKEVLDEANLPKRVYKTIISKLGSIDLKNKKSVQALQDYAEKAVNDSKVAEQFEAIEALKESIKVDNLPGRKQRAQVKELLKANPERIKNLDDYLSLLTDLAANLGGVKVERVKVTEDNFADLQVEYPELEQSDIGTTVVVNVNEPGSPVEDSRINDIFKNVSKDIEEYKTQETIDYLEDEDFADLDQELRDVINDKKSIDEVKQENKKKIKDAILDMIRTRVNKAKTPTGLAKPIFNVIKNSKNISKLDVEELKALLRGVDQGLTNGKWHQAYPGGVKLMGLDMFSNIPKMDIKTGSKMLYNRDNPALFFNAIFNSNQKDINKFRTSSGYGVLTQGVGQSLKEDRQYFEEVDKIQSEIEKKYNIPHGSMNDIKQVFLRQLLAEFMVRYSDVEATDADGISRAKVNLQSEMEAMMNDEDKTYGETAQEVYTPFLEQDFKTKQEVIDFAKKIDPASTEYTLKLIEFYNQPEIRNKAKDVSEVQGDGDFRDDMENVLPYRFVNDKTGTTEEDVVDRFRNGKNIAIPEAGSIKHRNRIFKEGSFRRPEQTAVLIEALAMVNRQYHTETGARLMMNFLNEDSNGKWSGSRENHKILRDYVMTLLSRERLDTLKTADNKTVNWIVNLLTPALLASPEKLLLQSVPAIANGMVRMFRRGGNPSYMFNNNKQFLQFIDNLPIGQRLDQMAGLSLGTEIDANAKRAVNSAVNKSLDKIRSAGNKVGHAITDTGSWLMKNFFGKGDFYGAKSIWAGNYLQHLKNKGVDVSKRDTQEFWENEAKLLEEGDPTRLEAVQAGEQEVGEITLPSLNIEKSPAIKRGGSAIRIPFPLLRYQMGFKRRLMTNWYNVASGKNPKEGITGLSGNAVEVAVYGALLYQLIDPLLDQATGVVAENVFGFDLPDDEEEKKKLRNKYQTQHFVKEFTPLPLPGEFSEIAYPFYNGMLYMLSENEDKSFNNFVNDTEKYFDTFDRSFMESLGYIGIGIKTAKELMEAGIVEDGVLKLKTDYGVKEIPLSPEQENYLTFRAYMKVGQMIGVIPAAVRSINDRIFKGIKKGTPAYSPNQLIPTLPSNLSHPEFNPQFTPPSQFNIAPQQFTPPPQFPPQ